VSHLQSMLAFIDAWTRRDIDAAMTLIHDDVVWHYAAAIAPPAQGKARVRRLLEGMAPQLKEVRWRIFDWAERGDRLFMEGVDENVMASGHVVSTPYSGVAEFRDGLIVGLREYFDMGLLKAQREGTPAPDHVRLLIAREAVLG
jgi:limonene-1,2-epoxide hydrolase